MSQVKVVMTGLMQGKVWVDGVEIPRVVGVKFGVDVDKEEHGCIEITQRVDGGIEIEGAMEVTVLDNQGSKQWAPIPVDAEPAETEAGGEGSKV